MHTLRAWLTPSAPGSNAGSFGSNGPRNVVVWSRDDFGPATSDVTGHFAAQTVADG
jgi:hypothetical protein